jgi:hypothetical protein
VIIPIAREAELRDIAKKMVEEHLSSPNFTVF